MWRIRRNRPPSPELVEVRARRKAAEHLLARDKDQIIIPLREIRAKNHVIETITMLIQQRSQQDRPNG
jgi:hypothetical protein